MAEYHTFNLLPENTPEQIAAKALAYNRFINGKGQSFLKSMADLQVAQFFVPKTEANKNRLITDNDFMTILKGFGGWLNQQSAYAMVVAQEKRFFHWFLEFPEVFAIGGFDCILGNPPFLGGQKLSGNFGDNFLEYIKYEFAPIGAVDLVTYFFRRNFTLIKQGGFQSLISTNTIAQGSAREDGLDIIVNQGGTINHAVKSMKWPGIASVEVALVSLTKQIWVGKYILDGKEVKTITPYLDDAETLGNPYPLKENEGKSFQGHVVLGEGFFVSKNIVEKWIDINNENSKVLKPMLKGEELVDNYIIEAKNHVIFFDEFPIEKAKSFCEPFKHVEEFVYPERVLKDLNKYPRMVKEWWKFWMNRKELNKVKGKSDYFYAIPRVTKWISFQKIDSKFEINDMVVAIFLDGFQNLAILNSSIHEIWARNYSSSLETRLRYSATNAFETFVIPKFNSADTIFKLQQSGKNFEEFRKSIMENFKLGITKIYNQMHAREIQAGITTDVLKGLDNKTIEKKFGKEVWNLWNHLQKTPGTCTFEEAVAGILKLRVLHVEMDNAVLEAYGWGFDSSTSTTLSVRSAHEPVTERSRSAGVRLSHDFYEVDYLPENDRVRYTIHPEARKEILKRLLELNHKIHEEEVQAGLWDKKKTVGKEYKKPSKTKGEANEPEGGYGGLFDGI